MSSPDQSPHASHDDPRQQEALGGERSLRLAQRIARLGSWEWTPEDDSVRWSEILGEIYGFDGDDGRSDLERFLGPVHPDDRERLVDAMESALDTGGRFQVEYRIETPDGELRHLLGRGEAAGADEADRGPLRLVGTAQDITEQKESSERELALIREQVARTRAEAERSFLERVFMQIPALVAITRGPEHRLELANPAFRETLGDREILDRPLREGLSDLETDLPFFDLLDRVYRSGEPFSAAEVHAHWQSGEDQPGDGRFNLVLQPLTRGDGSVYGTLWTGVDVTTQVESRQEVEAKAAELARLARELETSNAELDQFAYVASHDLKAPLRGIANLSQWIEEDLTELPDFELPAETREHLALLRGRVHRMEALIDGLLSYSRAGRMRNEPEEVDTGRLVREVCDLLGSEEGVEVVVGPDLPVLHTERLPLRQVLHNLIGNALKFGATRVRVLTEAGAAPGTTRFAVADDGPGIPPEYERKIWIMFQTLQARDQVEGTGMGLALVKKLVESRDGRVWVDSRPGEGATFRFDWPSRQLAGTDTNQKIDGKEGHDGR